MHETEKLLEKLEPFYVNFTGTLTAFSGGVDSALVLYLSRKFLGREKGIGVISNSESLKSSDYDQAQSFAKEHDINLITIKTEELSDDKYAENPHNRCYFCKTHLYQALGKVTEEYPGFKVLNGTNFDDLGDYRPGLQAAQEYQVSSPLLDAKLGKEQVRALAKYLGLGVWNKPASPCMSSRVPYGQSVTKLKLNQIERAELILTELGFENSRVRHLGSSCSIEVPSSQIIELNKKAQLLNEAMATIGFEKCVLDQEGLVSGKLNRVLVNG